MDVSSFKPFTTVLANAIASGLVAAALVDRNGNSLGVAGAVDEDEAMPLAALVMFRLKSADLAERLFAGEILSLTLDDRDVAVAIARRELRDHGNGGHGGSGPAELPLVEYGLTVSRTRGKA